MKQRKHIDCRSYLSDMYCTISIAAESEKELLEAAAQHTMAVHGHKDTLDLRTTLQTMIKGGAAPA